MKNIFISFEDGDSTLIYTENLTVEECEKFANKVSGSPVVDCYEIPDNDLQYYIIGGRIWIDTPEKENKVKAIINS